MAGWGTCRSCRARIWFGPSPYNPQKWFPFQDQTEQTSHFDVCPATEWIIDAAGVRQRVSECRTCGEKVWWQTTRNGARRPMDVEAGQWGHAVHFDTCAGVRAQPASVGDASRARAQGSQVRVPIRTGVEAWVADLGLSYPPLPSLTEVTSAFRALSMQHHPDMGGRAEDFIRIKMARDGLKALVAA